jgi:hypothetical protein
MMGYHNLVLEGLRDNVDWVTVSPREDYATIYREKCVIADVDFDDLVNGLRCEDSMVAVPNLNPNLLKGFNEVSKGHATAELYIKAPGLVGKYGFIDVLKSFIDDGEVVAEPLIEWCNDVTSLNDCRS